MLFDYTAMDDYGRQIQGRLEAPDEDTLKLFLEEQGYYLLSARPNYYAHAPAGELPPDIIVPVPEGRGELDRKGKILKWVGLIWIYATGGLIGIGYLGILFTKGFWALAEILSPFNISNFAFVIITLLPGIICLSLSQRYRRNRH